MAAVRLFLDMGANVDLQDNFGRTPLREAVERGHSNVVLLLREHGASLGISRDAAASTLCSLAKEGDKDTLERWIQAGIDVDAKDYDSRTALHIAVACGKPEITDMLISNGANQEALDRWGNTPLGKAVR
jgi:ankyrin repeat protein